MEEIARLVPVNPHSSEIVTEEVVERISGQKAQAVWDPIGLVRCIVVIGLGAFP